MIKKIDIYIIKEFFNKLIFLILGFIILFCLVSIIEHLDKFIDKSMPGKSIFMYHVYSLPWFISIALPMSILISTVFLFNSMQKNNELTALKASGVGLIRISIPLFIIGLLLSILSFKFDNSIVTQYLRKKINLEQEYNLKKSSKKQTRKKDIHKIIYPNFSNFGCMDKTACNYDSGAKFDDRECYYKILENDELVCPKLDSFNNKQYKYSLISDILCDGKCDSSSTTVLSIKKFKYLEEIGNNISIEYLKRIQTNNNEEKYKIIKRLDSPKFIWKKDKNIWLARKPIITTFSASDSILQYIQKEDLEIDIHNIIPYYLIQETLKPEEMNYKELSKLVDTMHENGIYNSRWVVDLYFKSAFACVNFLMVLFGICLSIRKPRTNMATGLTMSIGIIFLYYSLLIFGKSLGYSGILSPFVSVWGINIIFFIIGFYLFTKVKT